MEEKSILLQLKATLFDMHDVFTNENYKIQDALMEVNKKLKHTLQATEIKLFINQQQLTRLAPDSYHALRLSNISTDENWINSLKKKFSESKEDVLLLQEQLTLDHRPYLHYIVMKLQSPTNFKAYYLLTYDEKPTINHEVLIEMQQVVNKFFEVFCNHFYERFLQERNQLLFQLSANLHSVYRTTDVLKRVYSSVKILYPAFSYRFLMSHEYDDSSLPIDTINYSDNSQSLDTKAFMNNEIQLDLNYEQNKTVIYAPLTGRQGVYGVLEIVIPRAIVPNESDYHFINQSSKMIGRAVERTTLYQSSNQLITDLQSINLATRDINRNLEMAEISESVKKHIYNSCQAEEIGIVMLTKDNEGRETYRITKESTAYFKLSRAKDFVHYLTKRLKKNSEPILSGNFKIESLPVPFNSVMVIPMWDSEKMFGFIVIAHEKPYYFSFDKYKFIQSFVQHAALAYTNSLLKEQLRETAITDYLTKLYMRNYLDKKIDQHMATNQGGTFMLLDVDDFKLVNDTYGHYVGDRVLIQIANVLKNTLNDNEIAARWGGEEFAVYLPYSNAEYAEEVARNISSSIKTKTKPNVTVSIGISTWSEGRHSIEELFIRADEALYEAKSTGKDCIVFN